jgi:hypothetical protein
MYNKAQNQRKHKAEVNQKRKQGNENNSQATKKSRTGVEDMLDHEQMDKADISSSLPLVEDMGDPECEQTIQEDVTMHTSRP